MKSDIEIARSIELKKIKQVAEGIGILARKWRIMAATLQRSPNN